MKNEAETGAVTRMLSKSDIDKVREAMRHGISKMKNLTISTKTTQEERNALSAELDALKDRVLKEHGWTSDEYDAQVKPVKRQQISARMLADSVVVLAALENGS